MINIPAVTTDHPAAGGEVEALVRHTAKPVRLETSDSSDAELYAVPVSGGGYRLEYVDMTKRDPLRAHGDTELHDLDSFTSYIQAHARRGTTNIYCDAEYRSGKASFVAVLNDHFDFDAIEGVIDGNYRDFRAVYVPRLSEEWQRWSSHAGKAMSQAEFAAFIEENVRDIATGEGLPTGAQMLELALNMEASQDARFRSSIRLNSGAVNLEYVNAEDEATVKRMQLFERFQLGLPPYLNGPAYALTARLRYRIKAGTVTFWYELVRPDLVIADALRTQTKTIVDTTGFRILFGRPAPL